jgi:hypothetical protein
MFLPGWKVEANEADTGSQSPCQGAEQVGMTLADKPDVHFIAGRSETTWVVGAEAFVGLDLQERQILEDWLAVAKMAGIEMVVDFAPRPWRLHGLEVMIGVFETGRAAASWLLVRYQSRWVLATVSDGAVSEVCDSLSEALGLISRDRFG